MRNSLLYLFIYTLTLLFFANPIDQLMTISPGYALLFLAGWVAVSSGIVHIIHFWPTKVR